MPKKEPAPSIRGISGSDFKNRKRLIKVLVDQRLSYGKSVLYDTVKGQPRYPIDIIGSVLQKAEKKARAIGRSLNFSKDETDLISQIFKALSIAFLTFLLYQVLPLIENYRHQTDPDFIEKSLGLEDDAIEKTFRLPEHSIEKFIQSDSDNSNSSIHGPVWKSVASRKIRRFQRLRNFHQKDQNRGFLAS